MIAEVESSMVVNSDNVLLEQVIDDIYGDLATTDEAAKLPTDVISWEIVDSLRVYFVVDIQYIDGTSVCFPIRQSHLQRWKLDLPQLREIAGEGGGRISPTQWPKIRPDVMAYRYPCFDRDWIANLLAPRRLLEVNINGRPLVFIPIPEMVFVTGDKDTKGQKLVRKTMRELSDTPLTKSPIVYDKASERWRNYET